MRRFLLPALLALSALAASAAAQSPDTVLIAPAERDRLVARTAELVQARYVLPAQADAIAAHLRARLSDGAYAGIDTADALRAQLEQDLQSVNQAYNLQALKRARIVGERTKGGAHPSRNHRLNDHFELTIPFARSINPITRTNWEGTGVVPDLPANADEALGVAHLAALKGLAGKDSDPATVYELNAAIEAAQAAAKRDTTGARP